MAQTIQFIQGNAAGAASGTSIAVAFGNGTTQGNIILVGTASFSQLNNTISDGVSNVYKQVSPQQSVQQGQALSFFYASPCIAGATTITSTWGISQTDPSIHIGEFSGQNRENPVHVVTHSFANAIGVAPQTFTGASPITPIASGCLIFSLVSAINCTALADASGTYINAGTYNDAGTTTCAHSSFFIQGAAAAASDSYTATGGASSVSWTGLQIAICPGADIDLSAGWPGGFM